MGSRSSFTRGRTSVVFWERQSKPLFTSATLGAIRVDGSGARAVKGGCKGPDQSASLAQNQPLICLTGQKMGTKHSSASRSRLRERSRGNRREQRAGKAVHRTKQPPILRRLKHHCASFCCSFETTLPAPRILCQAGYVTVGGGGP